MPQDVKKIRWITPRDLQAVLRIEWASFEFPMYEAELVARLRQCHCIGLVAEDKHGRIVGYMLYESLLTRLQLLRIAVAPLERRQGVGRQMLQALTDKLLTKQRNQVLLQIPERNIEAQLFFRRHGYRWVTTHKNDSTDSADDTYVMQFRHNELIPAAPAASQRATAELTA